MRSWTCSPTPCAWSVRRGSCARLSRRRRRGGRQTPGQRGRNSGPPSTPGRPSMPLSDKRLAEIAALDACIRANRVKQIYNPGDLGAALKALPDLLAEVQRLRQGLAGLEWKRADSAGPE